jgi:hypothetical protein
MFAGIDLANIVFVLDGLDEHGKTGMARQTTMRRNYTPAASRILGIRAALDFRPNTPP